MFIPLSLRGGLKLDPALTLNQNLIFEMASKTKLRVRDDDNFLRADTNANFFFCLKLPRIGRGAGE